MKKLTFVFLLLCSTHLFATTWYVDHIGGDRYTTNKTAGLCDGTADTAPVGTTPNQHCAFNDVRFLWADGSYTGGSPFPGWGAIGAGGDTYIIKDCIQYSAPSTPIPGSSGDCRIGYSGPNSGDYFLAEAGNPGGSGAPQFPNGTSGAHTHVYGANYASCTSLAAKTKLYGGYGTGSVLNMRGSSYIDYACFDITDHSSCGRSGSANQCQTSYPLSDYANSGITWNNTTTNVSVTNVSIHGMAAAGMVGPTGDGVVIDHVSLFANGTAGWNLDPGDGTTGTGSLIQRYLSIQWSGCNEEYPIVDAIPVQDCSDDGSGGYGDGWGTTTVSSVPGWQVLCDHCTFAYNTQDGLDGLHITGSGSTVTATNSLFYGNMGNQLKIGGSAPTVTNNLIYGNCNALRQAIPGTPAPLSVFTGTAGPFASSTGDVTSGSNVITNIASTAGFVVGYYVYGNDFTGSQITAVTSTSVTMSNNAYGTATGEYIAAGSSVITGVSVTSGTITIGKAIGGAGVRPGSIVTAYDSVAHTITMSMGIGSSAGTAFSQNYNSALSDFCRAGDDAIALSVADTYTSNIQFNTVIGANSGAWLIVCGSGTCSGPVINFNDNVLLGFRNNATNGYPSGGSGNYIERLYFDGSVGQGYGVFLNPGSSFSYNDTYHEKDACPNTNETHALCVNPALVTSTWALYGTWPVQPASGSSPVVGAGVPVAGITTDYAGTTRPNPPSIGAYEFGAAPPSASTTLNGHVVFSGNVRF